MRLLASLALQNLGRRKARSFLLMAAVAVASGVVFTGATLMRSIDSSMAVGFTRLGADMMAVPEGALTNITAALLTVEPTDLVQLPKGEAFALIHGGQLHKMRMPLPSASSDPLMPTSLAAIGETLRARLDGPWNQPENDSEPEDRRDV